MRKKHEKKNKMGIWVIIFIVVIMLTSTIGYVFKGGSKEKYNDFSFSRTDDGRWYTEINGKQLAFDYFPSELENINLSAEIIDKIKSTRMIYFTHDPENRYREDIALLKEIFWPYFQIYADNGLTVENTFNLLVIDCDNATISLPVVYFKESNQTGFYLDNNCIICELRSGEDFTALKERLLYSLFGVME